MAMQQHERVENQMKAEAALGKAIAEVVGSYGLTTAEICMALSTALTRWTVYQLRNERDAASKS